MAKTYLDIVKYMVMANFSIEGLVDKPDIIGAIFGQTEGLLGDELDLRELQKGGKIGRIEIDLSQSGTKTYGKLLLPASLDRIETCILGAAVEAVDRVGPFDAQFLVDRIEDTRSEKRKKILDRAKVLLKRLLTTEIPDSKELAELVQSEVKASEIMAYGPDKVPAGPDVASSKEVVIVEGRADVLNLLKCDITNVVAIGGATSNIPKTIINLANEKEVTIFADGDRGGDLVIRSLMSLVEIDYVAKAPDGKEVEELTRKEIIKSLRSRVPLEQYLGAEKFKEQGDKRAAQQKQQPHDRKEFQQRQQPEPEPSRPITAPAEQPPAEKPLIKDMRYEQPDAEAAITLPQLGNEPIGQHAQHQQTTKPIIESAVLAELAASLEQLTGTLRSRLFSNAGTMIKEVPIRELLAELQYADSIYGVVLDGVITQRLIELAQQKGVRAIYGIRANPMPKMPLEILLYTKEQGKLT